MSSHHDNHSAEKKPVSFTFPLVFALVVVAIILALVSLGDPCPHNECAEHCSKECTEGKCSKECMEACEKGDHSKHPAAAEGEVKEDAGLPKIDTADAKEAAPTPEHNPAQHGH